MYKISKYPDGTSYISNVTSQIQTFRINSYEDLWHLNQYVDAFNSQFGFAPNIIIANLLDAQADRRFNDGESFGLKLVCKFLNSMNVKRFYIFHPHNPEVVEAMIDNVEIISNKEFVEEVLEAIADEGRYESKEDMYNKLILMSSDAGGFKPLTKLCDSIEWRGETFSAAKSRSWDEVHGTKFVQQIDRENFEGKDILIVDDICVYGGTFKGLAKLLKGRNIGKLYLAVSHITVQNHKNSELFDLYDRVFATDSKYDSYYIPQKDGGVVPNNLEIIKYFNNEGN